MPRGILKKPLAECKPSARDETEKPPNEKQAEAEESVMNRKQRSEKLGELLMRDRARATLPDAAAAAFAVAAEETPPQPHEQQVQFEQLVFDSVVDSVLDLGIDLDVDKSPEVLRCIRDTYEMIKMNADLLSKFPSKERPKKKQANRPTSVSDRSSSRLVSASAQPTRVPGNATKAGASKQQKPLTTPRAPLETAAQFEEDVEHLLTKPSAPAAAAQAIELQKQVDGARVAPAVDSPVAVRTAHSSIQAAAKAKPTRTEQPTQKQQQKQQQCPASAQSAAAVTSTGPSPGGRSDKRLPPLPVRPEPPKQQMTASASLSNSKAVPSSSSKAERASISMQQKKTQKLRTRTNEAEPKRSTAEGDDSKSRLTLSGLPQQQPPLDAEQQSQASDEDNESQ